MASIQFMSPRCDETSFIASLQPQTPVERQLAAQRAVARRLLLELRQLINPGARWSNDTAAAISHAPDASYWTVRDSTGLLRGLRGDESIPGGIVRIEATLATLGGTLLPHRLEIAQGPSMAGGPFMCLRGTIAGAPLKTGFDLQECRSEPPLDALVATRGDYAGLPLRHLLNRYDS